MARQILLLLLWSLLRPLASQEITTYEAQPVGGKEALDLVLQTQLTLPKLLLTKHFDTRFRTVFELDSAGSAVNCRLSDVRNNALRDEVRRVLGFLTFRPVSGVKEYYLDLHFSTGVYEDYVKQRSKPLKRIPPSDSSFIVHTRADRSPSYYRDGDAGLTAFILEEISYPALAKERSIEGTVVIEFIVEANGFVTNLKPLKTVNGGCTEEAERIMARTRWQPATIGGKAVRYRMSYPITFSLRNARDATSSRSVLGQ